MMLHIVRKYQDYDVPTALKIIADEVRHFDESRGWTGKRDAHYEELKKSLDACMVKPLDDLFGSWGKMNPPLKEYAVCVEHRLKATSKAEVRKLAPIGKRVVSVREVDAPKESKQVLIKFAVNNNGTITFHIKMGYKKGMSGSTPNQSIEEFKEYWNDKLHDKEVTYEQIG